MKNYHCSFRVPRNLLPESVEERYDRLYTLFSHSEIYCKAVDGNWEINLSFPSDPKYYIDEKLLDGLRWWADGTSVSDIPLEHKYLSFGKVMLHDTWTLDSWLDVIRTKGLTKFTILHFDAHSDLMEPKIGVVNGELYHLTTMKKYEPLRAQEVKTAVCAGSIDQGCYIAPLLHVVEQVEIIHIVPQKRSYQIYSLEPTFRADETLWPGTLKLSLKLVPYLSERDFQKNVQSRYHVMSDYSQVQRLLAQSHWPILLHIDMDYFCNRYNRRSDWYECQEVADDSLEIILTKLDKIADYLLNPHVRERLVSTDIALVPGFFPADYWERSIKHLEHLLG